MYCFFNCILESKTIIFKGMVYLNIFKARPPIFEVADHEYNIHFLKPSLNHLQKSIFCYQNKTVCLKAQRMCGDRWRAEPPLESSAQTLQAGHEMLLLRPLVPCLQCLCANLQGRHRPPPVPSHSLCI